MGTATLSDVIPRPPQIGMSFPDAARLRVQARMDAARLTPRQQEVVWALFTERSGAEIAADLGLKPKTVKMHLGSIRDQLRIEPNYYHSLRLMIVLRLLDLERIRDGN
jgi:DNA-binding CsgD family transcriptional regulator